MKRLLLLTVILATTAAADWDPTKPADNRRYDLRDDDIRANFAALDTMLSSIVDLTDGAADVNVAPIFNVNAFGADDTGATDCSTEVQTAIDAAASAGGIVYFPPGSYKVEELTLASFAYIRGVPWKSIIKPATNNAAVFNVTDVSGIVGGVTIEGLVFYPTGTGCYAMKGPTDEYTSTWTIKDCVFYANLAYGFYGMPANWWVENCNFGQYGTPGSHWQAFECIGDDSVAEFTMTFRHCWFDQCVAADPGAALEFGLGNTLNFYDCVWETLTTRAVRTSGMRTLNFIGCNIENVQPADGNDVCIDVREDGSGFHVYVNMDGCQIWQNGAYTDAIVGLTTTCHARFIHCNGRNNSGYYTQLVDTPTTFDDQITEIQNTQMVATSSALSTYSYFGETAAFEKFIRLMEDGTGANYVDFYCPELPANTYMTPIFNKSVDLTNANLKDLADTPIELVATHGAGTIIEVISALLILDYGSNALTEPSAPDDLALEYDNGDGAQIITWDSTGLITATADTIEQVNVASVAAFASASNVNKNVVLLNTGGDYEGNAGNDTTMRVIINYRVHTSLGL